MSEKPFDWPTEFIIYEPDEKPSGVPMKVSITYERYQELIAAEAKLNALERSGVDNWEWYEEAMATLEEEDD